MPLFVAKFPGIADPATILSDVVDLKGFVLQSVNECRCRWHTTLTFCGMAPLLLIHWWQTWAIGITLYPHPPVNGLDPLISRVRNLTQRNWIGNSTYWIIDACRRGIHCHCRSMDALLPEICRDHNRSLGHFDSGSIGIMYFMPRFVRCTVPRS